MGKLIEQQTWTLVVALSPDCRFCTASMPFYKRLRAQFSSIPFVVAGREDVEELTAYAESHGVRAVRYQQLVGNELGRYMTPMLILVDQSGVVRSIWRGQLSERLEQSVVRSLLAAGAEPEPQ